MMPLTAPMLAQAMSAELVQPGVTEAFTQVFTDTRRPIAGALFFALAGENFDAHDYIGQAVAGGAAGVVVAADRVDVTNAHDDLAVFAVPDTMAALTALGTEIRARHKGIFIAITGSVGKTTVKDMTTAALSGFGKVGSTIGNYNNAIGVPLSLAALDGDEDFVVLELGMSAPGEIAALTKVVRPHVGAVTCVEAAHLEFFDSVDAIADAKGELYENLPGGATAVAGTDDIRVITQAMLKAPGKVVSFAVNTDATIRVTAIEQKPAGMTYDLTLRDSAASGLPLHGLGVHNARNAAAALAIVHALEWPDSEDGVPVVVHAALALGKLWRPAKHRLRPIMGANQVVVLDDCYNANPASTQAALEALRAVAWDAPARCAVLGSMLELGPTSPALHAQAGAQAVTIAGCMHVYATGPYAQDVVRGARQAGARKAIAANDALELVDAVQAFAAPKRWILLKGSRGQRLERLLPALGAVEGAA